MPTAKKTQPDLLATYMQHLSRSKHFECAGRTEIFLVELVELKYFATPDSDAFSTHFYTVLNCEPYQYFMLLFLALRSLP